MSEQQIEERLNQLEQEVRRYKRGNWCWKIVGSSTIAALLALLLMGATGDKVVEEIRARRFVLLDKDGKTRATLGLRQISESHAFDVAALVLFDDSGNSGGGLAVTAEGEASLALHSKSGGSIDLTARPDSKRYLAAWNKFKKPQAQLLLQPNGSSDLVLMDGLGNPGAWIFSWPNGKQGISFNHNQNGNARLMVGTGPYGGPYIHFNDQNKKTRAQLELRSDGSPYLALYDKETQGHVLLTVDNDGSSVIRLTDKGEKARAAMALIPNERLQGFFLYDKVGNPIWSTPLIP